jgi:2-oxoglutarate dehydrogenase E2 component (dihydrolipoamide succinyltransferase)
MTSGTATDRRPITVPELGAGDEPIRVSAWLVDVGQTVIAGDRVVEVLIPGITFDIGAGRSGELVEVIRSADAVVVPGDVLGWIAVDE